jgi:hypothetical protein
MTIRRCVPLLALVALAACGGGARPRSGPTPETPSRYFLDRGSVVRAHLRGEKVTGPLVVPYRFHDAEVVLCEAAQAPCASPTAPGVRTLLVDSIRRLDVRGKKTGVYAYRGVYLGAGAGLIIGGDDDGTSGLLMALGAGAFGALGGFIGSRVTGWVTVFPCAHACGWQAEPDGTPVTQSEPDSSTAPL